MDFSVLGHDVTVVVRVLVACAVAFPIGLEREINGKPAGVRTHVLLAAAAAALGWLSVVAAEGDSSADPTRIASYTVAGISFLGGGLIVGVHTRVHGLTTAVGAFAVTAIGLLSGMGYPLACVTLGVAALLTLAPLQWFKTHVYGRYVRTETTIHLVVTDTRKLDDIHRAISDGVELRVLTVNPLGDGSVLANVTVRGHEPDVHEVAERLTTLECVTGVALVAGP